MSENCKIVNSMKTVNCKLKIESMVLNKLKTALSGAVFKRECSFISI
jgi:hypothetical protein